MRRAAFDLELAIFIVVTLGIICVVGPCTYKEVTAPPIPRPDDRRVYETSSEIDVSHIPNAASSECDAGILTDSATSLIDHLARVGPECTWYLYSPNGASIEIRIRKVTAPTSQLSEGGAASEGGGR